MILKADINEILQQRADLNVRLSLISYEGTPEVKERDGKRYLYMRKRVGGRLTSTYVDVYSEELHQLLVKNAAEARALRKQIRALEKQLAQLGYSQDELSSDVLLNLDFARANLKSSIYDQAILEGVSTTFPQTEDILENGLVNGIAASDIQKILNLKHAWEFILDKDVIRCPSNLSLLSYIAGLVNEGFYVDGGRIRGVPVAIGGTSYIPSLPQETVIKERLSDILARNSEPIDKAIELCISCMKWQIFMDGNKRASTIFANHYLIAQGCGLLVVPEKLVSEFRTLLVTHYEGTGTGNLIEFMKQNCWRKLEV